MTAPFVSLPHSPARFPPLSAATSFRDPTDLLCNPAPNPSKRFTGRLHPSPGAPSAVPSAVSWTQLQLSTTLVSFAPFGSC